MYLQILESRKNCQDTSRDAFVKYYRNITRLIIVSRNMGFLSNFLCQLGVIALENDY